MFNAYAACDKMRMGYQLELGEVVFELQRGFEASSGLAYLQGKGRGLWRCCPIVPFEEARGRQLAAKDEEVEHVRPR